MKLIQVSAYYPPRIGGMQNVVREFSERLAHDENQEVIVYTSKIDTNPGRINSSKNLLIKYYWGFEFANTSIVPGMFLGLLLSPRSAIMHIHTPRPFVAEVAALAALIKRMPYVVEVHSDIQPLGFFKFLIPIYKRIFWRWVMLHADMVIFLSHAQEEDLKVEYGLKKTIVIPNGVDKSFYIKNKVYKNISSPHLLFVGRLNKQKNLPFLIEALSFMDQRAILDIVGEGSMKETLLKLISDKKLESRVILHGKKVGKELIDIYKNAHVYVMASHFEGLSLAMLEAMASSLPVVALNAPGVTEHIDEAGVIVRSSDPKIFAKEIDELIVDKKRLIDLSLKSYKYASSLSWTKMTKRLLSLYNQLSYKA